MIRRSLILFVGLCVAPCLLLAQPVHLSPPLGAVLDNGCSTPPPYDNIVRNFEWSSVPAATAYNLYVIGPTASVPTINVVQPGTQHHSVTTSAYVAPPNAIGWRWKVRAMVGGVWGPYSAERTFNVEMVNTDCTQPEPVLSIDDASLLEGNTGGVDAVFTVTMTPARPETVSVFALTAPLGAVAGVDFSTTGPLLLTFSPGETTKTFPVPVLGDLLAEGSETFQVTLYNPANGTLGDAVGVGTIVDNDAARAFVSSSGSNAGACSIQTTPCATIAAAIAQVATDGEIIVLTPGEYEMAPLVISKGVKVTSPSGTVAFIRQPITVNAPGARVILRGLTIKGAGTGDGITLTAAGALLIEETTVDGWATGLKVAAGSASFVAVANSAFISNTSGLQLGAGGTNRVSIEGTRFEGNGLGVSAASGAVLVRESSFVGQVTAGILVNGGSAHIHRSEFSQNSTGVSALSGGAVRIARSRVFGNITGLSAAAGSTFESLGTNVIRGNGTNTTGTITTLTEQ